MGFWEKRRRALVEPRPEVDREDRRTEIVLEKLDYAVARFEDRARTIDNLLKERERGKPA